MNKLTVVGNKRSIFDYNIGSYWICHKSGNHYILVEWPFAGFLAINIKNGALWSHPKLDAKDAVAGLDFIGDVEITLKY